MLLRSIILKLSGRPSIEKFVRNSRVTRGVVRRFIAGDTLEDAMKVADELAEKGFFVTLDFLGEHTTSAEAGQKACDEYKNMLRRIAVSPHFGGTMPEKINISIKLTQLGLLHDEEVTFTRLLELLDEGNFVRIDMEDSACVDRTLTAARRAFRSHKNVGVVLQSMLYRTDTDLQGLIQEGMRIRLVKGAYLENETVAQQDKKDVDEAYVRYAHAMLLEATYPAFGTHDEKIIEDIIAFAKSNGISAERFEFQFLHGIRRDLQKRLLDSGYGVRVYVPYGNSWYPYFTRRLAERPANLLFFIRSLFSK